MNEIKWDRKFALEQVAGEVELLDELIDVLKKSCAADLRLIKKGIAENDPAKIYSAAHSMKGASASLGIQGIVEIARDIEKESSGGTVAEAKVRLSELEYLLKQLADL